MTSKSENLPLSGLKVLEIAGLAPAPFCGLILADFGADVIRIDRYGFESSVDTLGRGKRSIAINFKSKDGIEAFLKLIEKADVIIEPFRPGVAERLGFGPDVAMKRNPRLIYARLTGFGQKGPYADMAGHDVNYLALSGVLSMLGRKGETPCFPINLLADFAGGGLTCAFGIVLAVLERHKSGKGQVIDSAMMDGVAYISTFLFTSSHLFTNERGENLLDTGAPFYETYKTKDGKYVAIGAIEPQFYAALLKGLNLNPETLPEQNNQKEWPKMKEKFTQIFLSKTQDEWRKIFDGTDACVTPILNLNEVMQHPHPKERQLLVQDSNNTQVPKPAPTLTRTPGRVHPRRGPEVIGQDTVQVLQEFGFSKSEIERLIQMKAIGGLPKSSL
jgi:alpha-methylacyl-CoA racemase